jgi:hypothetical protein
VKTSTDFWLVVALAFGIAGIILGVIGRAWAIVCVGVAAALIAASLLF